MASLFLGRVGKGNNIFEIHALTNGHRFREMSEADISDPVLYQQILKGRYQMLANGNAIYCTAVNPITEKQIEYNPHDDREGTVHFVAIDEHGVIEAALAVAVDLGATDRGTYVGVPLENRWKSGDYPVGDNLDKFRTNYVRLTHNEDRDILPYEIAELYRHYKRFGTNNTYARLGLYCASYHLLVREARKRQKTATTLWVFDAIPQYFNLYRYAGAAVLREFTINEQPLFISPSKRDLSTKHCHFTTTLEYKGLRISRNVTVPIPHIENDKVLFVKQDVPFLDGIIDLRLIENATRVCPRDLSPIHFEGFTEKETIYLRETIKLLLSTTYDGKQPLMPNNNNGGEIVWDFNKLSY